MAQTVNLMTAEAAQVLLAAIEAATPAPVNYSTRADLVSVVAGGLTWGNGTLLSDGTVPYVAQSGATVIPDLPGLVPVAPVRPDHFGSNTTPGVTNMRPAINLAVQAYKHVRFFGTTYAIGAAILPQTGCVLEGDPGAEIFVLSSTAASVSAVSARGDIAPFASGIEVRGLRIDGNAGVRGGGGGNGVTLLSSGNTIENCEIVNNPNSGVGLSGAAYECADNRVTNNRVTGNLGVGVSQASATNSEVRGNYFRDNGLENLTVDVDCQNCLVIGNTFKRHLGGVGNIGAGAGGDSNRIIGNFIDNENDTTVGATWRNGIHVLGNDIQSRGTVITGNTIVRCGYAGILLQDTTSGTASETGQIMISGNAFEGNAKDIRAEAGAYTLCLGENAWSGSGVEIAVPTNLSGTTAQRPVGAPRGATYFDATLGKPVFWTGAGWVDSAGVAV